MRKTLVITSDDHVGHPFALPASGDGWDYTDGGRQENTGWQNVIWQHWEESWRNVADLRKGGELIVVHAGDAIEGVHHGTVQLLTQRVDEQERMHVAAMEEGLALGKWNRKRGDKLFYLSGTPAHTGEGNSSTERIVRSLLDDESSGGSVIRPYLLCSVNGVLFDIAHKGYGLGSRAWTRTNTMRAWLVSQHMTSLKRRKPLPRHFVRAHRHTFGHTSIEDDYGCTIAEAWLMASWKLKDEYVYSFAAEAVSNIGLIAWTIDDGGNCKAHPMLMQVEQDDVEEL